MKGIILAAGQGARLRPLTDDRPKCMVEYQGHPLIDHIFASLSVGGVDPAVVVSGYRSDVLEHHLRDKPTRFVLNRVYASTNMVHSLFLAEAELDRDVMVSYSDIIYDPTIVKALLACPADLAITIDLDWHSLWARRMEDPLSDAETLLLGPQGQVLDLGRKPRSMEEIQGQYMGLIKFSGRILPRVRAIYHSLDRQGSYDGKTFPQMYMTTLLRLLIQHGIPCQSVPIRGGWLEVDAQSDLQLLVEGRGAA